MDDEQIRIIKSRSWDFDKVLALYEKAGWVNYSNKPSMLRSAWENSLALYLAYSGENLIGICRLVGDGHSVILVQDILVAKEYQRKKVGTRLLEMALEEYKDVYQKILLADNQPALAAFYEKAGFKSVEGYAMKAYICFGENN